MHTAALLSLLSNLHCSPVLLPVKEGAPVHPGQAVPVAVPPQLLLQGLLPPLAWPTLVVRLHQHRVQPHCGQQLQPPKCWRPVSVGCHSGEEVLERHSWW